MAPNISDISCCGLGSRSASRSTATISSPILTTATKNLTYGGHAVLPATPPNPAANGNVTARRMMPVIVRMDGTVTGLRDNMRLITLEEARAKDAENRKKMAEEEGVKAREEMVLVSLEEAVEREAQKRRVEWEALEAGKA